MSSLFTILYCVPPCTLAISELVLKTIYSFVCDCGLKGICFPQDRVGSLRTSGSFGECFFLVYVLEQCCYMPNSYTLELRTFQYSLEHHVSHSCSMHAAYWGSATGSNEYVHGHIISQHPVTACWSIFRYKLERIADPAVLPQYPVSIIQRKHIALHTL